jgi:hypothetical protein
VGCITASSLLTQRGRPEKTTCPSVSHTPSLYPLLLLHVSFLMGSLSPLCPFLLPTSPLPRVFVPSFTYRVSAQLVCVGGRGVSACPLTLRLRPKAPPLHNSSSVACEGASVCQLELALPPWGHWVYMRVETPSRGPSRTIRFQLVVWLQGEKPHICTSHPNICGWEVTWMAVFCDPLLCPYSIPFST